MLRLCVLTRIDDFAADFVRELRDRHGQQLQVLRVSGDRSLQFNVARPEENSKRQST